MIPLLLGLFGGLIHYAGFSIERFERHAAVDIAETLTGPGKAVQIRSGLDGRFLDGEINEVTVRAAHFTTQGLPLFTEPERSKRGRIRRLKLELTDFSLNGLRIESLSAVIPQCRFDLNLALKKKQIRLSKSGLGDGTVKVLAADLGAFILKKYPEIKRVSVQIDPLGVHVEGFGEFLLIATNFRVDAALEPRDGNKLFLKDALIEFDGVRATDGNILLDTLNPVVDLDRDLRLLGAIEIRTIELGNGFLIARGRTQIPVKPRSQVSSSSNVRP